jgi:methionyl-tRNA formyltransferase
MTRIAFLGRGPIAERCYTQCIHNENIEIVWVCSNKNFREKFSIEKNPLFVSNKKRNEKKILDLLQAIKIDYLISVQHPWIISKRSIDVLSGLALNLHNAKLPEYQGFNSISHAILNGDKTYTTTIHWIIPEVDAGPLAYEETIEIRSDDTAKTLYCRAVEASVENFKKLISDLEDGVAVPKKQMCGIKRFYKREEIIPLKKIKNIINYDEVDKKVRAFSFYPHEPAHFYLNDEKFYLFRKLESEYYKNES